MIALQREEDERAGASVPERAVEEALAAGADAAQAVCVHSDTFEVNFDRVEVTLLRSYEQQNTELTAFLDGKRGSSRFTGGHGIDDAARAAVGGAAAGVQDDANTVETGGPRRLSVERGPTDCHREAMVERVLEYVRYVARHHPLIRPDASHYSFTLSRCTFVNSAGLERASQRGSYQFYTCFAGRDGDRSASINYTMTSAWEPFGPLIEVGTLRRLLEETGRSFDPRPVKGKFIGDLIIAPDCVPSLLGPMVQALDGYNLISGTTPYADALGQPVASEGFTLRNRPGWEGFAAGADFDPDGVPTRDVGVIVDGRLTSFLIDRYAAIKLGRAQTSGRVNLYLEPGDASIDEIIAGTRRGILLGRFSGGRPNRNLDFSGVAKNSFYVEDGQIRHALSETMVSGNLGELLRSVRAVSREHFNFGSGAFPWLAVSGATISSG